MTDQTSKYRIRRLAGRCANGYERDSGRRNHAVPEGSLTAVCGATYGRRSAGWSEWDETEVTCPKCLERLVGKALAALDK